MRVTHVITGLGVGGAETALYRVLGRADRSRIDSKVISLTSGGAFAERLRDVGVEVIELGMTKGLGMIDAFFRLRHQIHEDRADIIHAWMYHAALLTLLARPKAPVVVGIRQSLDDMKNEKFSTRCVIHLLAKLSRKAHAVIYNSQSSARQHRSVGYGSAVQTVIPNGFDCDIFGPDAAARAAVRQELGVADDALIIGHVGRFHPVKNHIGLLRSFAHIIGAHDRARLVMAGEGVVKGNPMLARAIALLGVEGRVTLLGARHDLARLYAGFDLLANASHGEAFPNVIGEAMAVGVPCVATDVGDTRVIVAGSGIVVPAGDDKSLADGLDAILSMDPDERAALSRNARAQVCSRFSLNEVVERYSTFYESIVAPSPAYVASGVHRS